MVKLNDGSTISDDGPECPTCGFTFTPDEPSYYDPRNYTDETCQECGTKFKVEVQHSVNWQCEAVQPEPVTS